MMDTHELGRVLVERMPDALLVSDAQGIIRFWNSGAERIFGFTADEAIGQSLDLIIPDNLRGRHWSAYHETVRTGWSRYAAGDLLSVPAMTRDGRRISVQFSILPLPAPNGGLRGVAAIMRDVTAEFDERKELRKRLQDRNPDNAARGESG